MWPVRSANAVIVAIICDRGDRYLSTGVYGESYGAGARRARERCRSLVAGTACGREQVPEEEALPGRAGRAIAPMPHGGNPRRAAHGDRCRHVTGRLSPGTARGVQTASAPAWTWSQILCDVHMGIDSAVPEAALLYRAVEEGRITMEQVEQEFSAAHVAKLLATACSACRRSANQYRPRCPGAGPGRRPERQYPQDADRAGG